MTNLYIHAAQRAPSSCHTRIAQADFNGIPKSPIPKSTAGLKKPPEIVPTVAAPMMTTAPIAKPK